MKARAVSNLEGDFSDPESFVTEGNPVTVINVGVATNTGTIDMGTLLEGNAIDDDPATEPGSVINALGASLLAAAINEGTNDPSVDFTRNGTVDQDDLDLLKANYLRFSPIPV